MAEADGYELNEKKWEQIMKAREYYEEFGTVPPIRKFANTSMKIRRMSSSCDDWADEADHQIRRHAQADRLRLRRYFQAAGR